ncbi:protein transport protein SFT2 isoform X2 [Capsicum annuum]
MHKTAQSWFTGGPSNDVDKNPSSLLADWNAYAADQDNQGSSSDLGFDLEAAVRTANDKVSGTFNVVSKGVKGLPGSFQSATSNVPSGKSLMYFGLFLAAGVFFIFIAFTMFLPVMVLMPQKFAICFTIGCAFIIGSFFALKGPKNQLTHMTSKETSFYRGFYWQHGRDRLRLYGAPQLYSFCALLSYTGLCSILLCYLLFPWRFSWDEISFLNTYILYSQMFWKVTTSHHFPHKFPLLLLRLCTLNELIEL